MGPPGHGQYEVPQMVTVRYQVKKGSQQRRKAPSTMPSVTNALCSFRHDVWMRWRSRSPEIKEHALRFGLIVTLILDW